MDCRFHRIAGEYLGGLHQTPFALGRLLIVNAIIDVESRWKGEARKVIRGISIG